MRPITLKYAGECRKCSASLDVGAQAIYEKRVGVFCPSCGPTETEEIREFRQEAADRKADKYDDWAQKRRTQAHATLNNNRRFTRDIAFCTQPRHIPFRARIIKQDDRAHESLSVAAGFSEKADRLRHVRVAGDTERRRQAVRDAMKGRLTIGMKVNTGIYGTGIVKRINKKTATIGETGSSGTYTVNVDLSFLRIL